MKDGGRITFLPDLISSRLVAVVISLRPTIQEISCQEAKVLQGVVLPNSHVFSQFKGSEESPKWPFVINAAVVWALESQWMTDKICM